MSRGGSKVVAVRLEHSPVQRADTTVTGKGHWQGVATILIWSHQDRAKTAHQRLKITAPAIKQKLYSLASTRKTL